MELTLTNSSTSKGSGQSGVRSPGGASGRARTGEAEASQSQSQGKVTRRRKRQLQETSTPTSPWGKQVTMKKAKEQATAAHSAFEKGMDLLYRAAQWVEYSVEVPQVFIAEITGKNPIIMDFRWSTRIDPTTSTFRFFDDGYGNETVEMELEDGTQIEFVSATVDEQEDESCESDTESSYSTATDVITPGTSVTNKQEALKNRPGSPYPITSRKSTSTVERLSVIQYAPAYRCDYHEQDKDDTGEHL